MTQHYPLEGWGWEECSKIRQWLCKGLEEIGHWEQQS